MSPELHVVTALSIESCSCSKLRQNNCRYMRDEWCNSDYGDNVTFRFFHKNDHLFVIEKAEHAQVVLFGDELCLIVTKDNATKKLCDL